MKRGLNYLDVNSLKLGLTQGMSLEEIARECKIPDVNVLRKYLDSMDPKEVEALKAQAPAQAMDMEQIKAQVKAEILAEMQQDTQEISPQQKAANTRKANAAREAQAAAREKERPTEATPDVLEEMRKEAASG